MTVVRCVSCGLRQWALRSTCARCHTNLGFSVVEIPLQIECVPPNDLVQPDLRIGPMIRSLRLRRGKSQRKIAAMAQISRSHLCRMERSESTPNMVTFLRILRAVGVECLYLRQINTSP